MNEAIDNTRMRDVAWRRLIGDDYIDFAFQFAHEADPDALLFYNDYGAEGMNPKSDRIYELVSDMVARGVPIHGVGLQTHITIGDTAPNAYLSPENLTANLNRLGELGLQVQITEMDVRYAGNTTDDILRRQAADYHRVMDTCLASEYCTAFIAWGVTDQYSWLKDARYSSNPNVEPLLFDADYQPKPAYYAVLDSLARAAGMSPILNDAELEAMMDTGVREVDIPDATFLDPEQLAPDSVDGAVYYAAFPVSITLDGRTDDWENIPRVTVDSGPQLPSNNDTSMTFAAAASDQYLYFLAEVKDSNLVYGLHDPASEWYLEDSVEFYINATGKLDATSYAPGIAQIGILAANITLPDVPIIAGGNSSDSQVEAVAVETDDGYIIEAAVPLVTDVWSIKPRHMSELGFQAHLNGSSGNDRDTKLIWSLYDTQDQSWTNPAVFGRLVFWFEGF